MENFLNLNNSILQKELINVLQAVNHSSQVSISDNEGKITYVNDKFCEISKYDKDEILGKYHNILKSGHHPERFYADLWKKISSGNIWAGEIKNRAKDGSYYWVFTTIVPSPYGKGIPQNYVSIRFDITEKKQMEDKLNKLKIDLDQATIEREIREQFFSTLSHDLKTPLTIAKISAQIIERKYSDVEKLKTLSVKIAENIGRVDTMVNSLLDANRNRSHQNFILDFSEFNMKEMLASTLDGLSSIHGERFILNSTGNVDGYWCHSGIQRIFENLINNAIKYGDPSFPIEIKIKGTENQLIFSVHNKGNPISEVDQRIIFDYLQRTSSAELGSQKGWGLGLTLVKSMAEAHGGNVRVFSFAGNEGTTFTVTLPKDARLFAPEKRLTSSNLIMANECDNFLRLFRHMPEIITVLTGPDHMVEFVNEAYVEIFGFDNKGLCVRDLSPDRQVFLHILDGVFASGIPHKVLKTPLIIKGKKHYFNHIWVPRKNDSGNIMGVLSISSEVFVEEFRADLPRDNC